MRHPLLRSILLILILAGVCGTEPRSTTDDHKHEVPNRAAHLPGSPEIRHVCAVAPDVLAITLQAGFDVPDQLTPYVAQPGDEIEQGRETFHVVTNGRIVDDHDKALFRIVNGKRTRVCRLSPDGICMYKEGISTGTPLDESVVDSPRAYTIQSPDDSAYARPTSPKVVYRKGKPNGHSKPLPFEYIISLQLSSALKEGASYTIRFVGVNTSSESVTYVHQPRKTRSDAIHAIQTGYRPDDPYKRAYLSFWLGASVAPGTTGGTTHQSQSFELIDAATGSTVFTGKPELTKAVDAKERLSVNEENDYTHTAVHRLDFSRFRTPGTYRIHVPGIGVSGTFRVASDVWVKPFQAAMMGILNQRQGIELGPPFTTFRRGRAFHPDDGVEFFQLSIVFQEGQEGERGKNMIDLAKEGKLDRVTGIWGGYQDAGDWDTLGHHLSATYKLLELYELAPAYFAKEKLSLPANEQTNAVPDLLDEAMWQMPCFRRLQLPDGGVRGGYGEGWGCRDGQISPMVKSAGVYAADHVTSYSYAACAARASRVMANFDKKLAGEYLASGRKAWDWAEIHADDALYRRMKGRDTWPPYLAQVKIERATAAIQLYAATEDPAFHESFLKSTELTQKAPIHYLEQSDADFAYARLGDNLANPLLKERARKVFRDYADYAIEFSHKNGFELINGNRTDLPVIGACSYFSSPGVNGYNLVRAYVLTEKPAYLAAVVQACNYGLGANPDNLSYCTGIGHKFVHHPFKLDATLSGQPDQPIGYIPFGQGDESSGMNRAMNGWVRQWYLNFVPRKMIPDFYAWPANESYIDFSIYPQMNESCFNSTTLAAAYYWGFLASRP